MARNATDGRTKKRDDRFFAELEEHGTVAAAAKAADYARSTVYVYKENDPEFRQRWEDALAIHLESMERECDRRGRDGVDKPVFYKGEKVATVKDYSDTLLIFRMKGLAPEKYRDRIEHTGADGGPIETKETGDLELARKLAFILESAARNITPSNDTGDAQ